MSDSQFAPRPSLIISDFAPVDAVEGSNYDSGVGTIFHHTEHKEHRDFGFFSFSFSFFVFSVFFVVKYPTCRIVNLEALEMHP